MTRETVDSGPNLSLQQKARKFISWLSHRDGPVRNWRYIPTHVLLRKLQSESAEMRAYAAEGLGGVGNAHAVAPLINALSDNNSTVRRFAISSLGHIRDPRAIDVLIPFLQDEEADMRCAAVVALGELGLSEERFSTPPVQVIEALMSSIWDADRAVCSAAVVALGRIGNPQAIPALNELAEATESEWIRRYISEALHQIEEQNA
ncbi:MAG: HEAT repeat domain-containing protein [Candidatus Poribacteria bacterium]|nr:HEAT repeat domain-containing protein [Candidatus Poribacteria bacterium]